MANILKRGNTFRIRVYVGTDMNGKKIMKSTTYVLPVDATPKKAEKLAQEYAYEFERQCKGYSQLNENMRFSELADWYFTNYAPHELKESTVYTYKGQYKNHIEPVLGNMKVKDITTLKFTQIMQSYKLNPATVRKLYVIVQSIFKRIIRILLFTGMRSGECFALRWEDIDFEKMSISIRHTLNDIGGKHELTSPKTKKSIRTIGMSETVASVFKAQKEYIDELKIALGENYAHPEMVFPSANGNYRDRSSVLTSLKRFTKCTEFEGLTLHKLRQCNATMLLNMGVDLKVISDHLGHCDINVTADIYADVLSSTRKVIADSIEKKLTE